MKRFVLLFALFVVLMLLTLTYNQWGSWLLGNLSDKKTSSTIDSFAGILTSLSILGGVVLAFLTYMGFRKSPAALERVPPPAPAINAGYVQDRPYEPTPLDVDAKPLDAAESPFLGLSAFRQQDAHLFFGRRRETREALAYLGASMHSSDSDGEQVCRWLQIEGNSGAGKSSLVNAGMLPLVQQNVLQAQTGFRHWQIVGPFMPGETPLRRLAEALETACVPEPDKRDSLARQQRLENDPRALSYMLNDHKRQDTAFVVVVDQFEELFTFSDREEKQQFDIQLSYALQDKDCPLFLISTVRIDFLEGFEQLPHLSELYNLQCKRYLLKTISQEGLREAIEQPAGLAGLDTSEVTAAMLRDASGEVGALPLVENALHYLWENRNGNRLSGSVYTEKGGIVGLLEEQADTLLVRLDHTLPKGRHDALELLLALTRINDEGRHTRRRLPLEEARLVAGGKKADPERGQRIIDYLTGRLTPDCSNQKVSGSLRLLTTVGEKEEDQSIDLIHETLIRARGKDPATGKLFGYWKTLYNYIEINRARGFYRDQLARQADEWQAPRSLGSWRKLASWRDLKHYQKLRPARGSVDARFLRWSRWLAWAQAVLVTFLLAFAGESYWWTLKNGMPPGYMLMQQKFRLMAMGWVPEPLPEMVEIAASDGEFEMGELEHDFVENIKSQSEFSNNFGIPSTQAVIAQPFALGKYEVTYEQYDYYVWWQQNAAQPPHYPNGAPGDNGRGLRAVANVSWNDANGYLRWLSDKTGDTYRLPTEAEWEYAARAGTTMPYWWGDKAGERQANCDGCGSEWDNQRIAPIGSFAPNAWRLHDTAGNVWEWTCSEWKNQFDGSEGYCTDPTEQPGRRVVRGGSWVNTTEWLRSSARYRDFPDYRVDNVGFRVLRSARTH